MYAASPAWLQNLGVTIYGYAWRRRRYGGIFSQEVDKYLSRETYSIAQWDRYQSEELGRILSHAIRRVPHYRDTYQAIGYDYLDIGKNGLEILQQLPIVEKEMIRKGPHRFLSEGIRTGWLYSYQTSGTTGTPLTIRLSAKTHQRISAAYEARCRRWAGVNSNMSRAMIGGRLVVSALQNEPPYWRYNAAERQLYLSAFHISRRTVADYVKVIRKYKPDYLVGYASAHYSLARFIDEEELVVGHRPKAILTSSEKLTPIMRETLERVYHCSVFDGYSGVESCCLASECEHQRLHVSGDVGVIELLDEAGQPVAPGKVGEIVATGLLNYDQPLIRYRTGDLAIWDDQPCPCGRAMPVLRDLVGRIEDTVVGPDGRETVRFHGLFIGIASIREAQVIQETLTIFRILLVVDDEFRPTDKQAIVNRMSERLGQVNVIFELVDEIERTQGGKYRAVISKVTRGHF